MIAPTLRLLLVEHHPWLRSLIRQMVEMNDAIQIVGEVITGAEAVEAARRLSPDLILMDVRLPDGSGLAIMPLLIAERPDTKVVLLGDYDLDIYKAECLRLGASAYVPKLLLYEDLQTTLRDVSGRKGGIASD